MGEMIHFFESKLEKKLFEPKNNKQQKYQTPNVDFGILTFHKLLG